MERAAHEIKNPLNGLAVNLEVVRSRAERGGDQGAVLARFASAAAAEAQRVTERVEALMAVSRPARTPVDLWMVIQPLVALHAAIAAPDGGTVTAVRPSELVVETSADPAAVRLAVASALDAVVRDGAVVRCVIARHEGRLTVSVLGAPPAPVGATLRDALARAGIALEPEPDGFRLLFAPSGATS